MLLQTNLCNQFSYSFFATIGLSPLLMKYKADNLLESGAVKPAILIYQSIIHGAHDDSVDGKFYGRVYGCLGAAYGKIFLYEEAAKMYEAAFQICEEESMRRAYLYCCKKSMSSEKVCKAA